MSFHVSSWHAWNCECSELVLTFSQTFCLKTNARSHSLQPLLNGQILLTSLFPEECNCILFPPRSRRVPAACQCKQFPSLPRRPAPEARELHGLREASPCRVANAGKCKPWKPGYLVPGVREVALCFSSPVPAVLGELGDTWIGLRWLFLWRALCARAEPERGLACDAFPLFPLSPCPSFRGPALRERHSCALLPAPVEACPASPKSPGASARREPLAWSPWGPPLARDSPAP